MRCLMKTIQLLKYIYEMIALTSTKKKDDNETFS